MEGGDTQVHLGSMTIAVHSLRSHRQGSHFLLINVQILGWGSAWLLVIRTWAQARRRDPWMLGPPLAC